MSTMSFPMPAQTLPFGDVEERVISLKVCFRDSNRWMVLFRLAFKATVLAWQFQTMLQKQQSLIDALNGPSLQNVSSAELGVLAEKLNHLIGINNDFLDQCRPKLSFLEPSFKNMIAQLHTLESLAESYEWASDADASALLGFAADRVCA